MCEGRRGPSSCCVLGGRGEMNFTVRDIPKDGNPLTIAMALTWLCVLKVK